MAEDLSIAGRFAGRNDVSTGYLYSFDRMDFQQTGKQDNAERFERGYLKVTTENLTNWDLPVREKPPETNDWRCPKYTTVPAEIKVPAAFFPKTARAPPGKCKRGSMVQ